MDFSDFFPVWNDLKETERRLLTSAATELNVFKGAVISDGKDACSGIMLIESGQIRAYTTSPEGKEITLYRLLERDICLFSASCMLNGINFDVTLAAEKDCRVILIPSDAYKHVMSESAPGKPFFRRDVADRTDNVEKFRQTPRRFPDGRIRNRGKRYFAYYSRNYRKPPRKPQGSRNPDAEIFCRRRTCGTRARQYPHN